MAINLLSQELKPKPYVVNFAKILKKLAMVSLLVFLVGVMLLVGIIFIFSQRTKANLPVDRQSICLFPIFRINCNPQCVKEYLKQKRKFL